MVEELASEALKDRHWEQIFTILGVPYPSEAEFSINDLLEHDIMSKLEEETNMIRKFLVEFNIATCIRNVNKIKTPL